LTNAGIEVAALWQFPDHHAYSRDDVESLQRWADSLDVVALVTTQKDLVKIQLDHLGERPLWALQIGVEIVRGGDILEQHLRRTLERVPAGSSGQY
jgi:tetraacyldisaccharide 4'-kinase